MIKKLSTFLQNNKVRISFLITGFLASAWFLIRIIQKPSRINYPCMQASAPIMSGFILYIAGLAGTGFGIIQLKSGFSKKRLYTILIAGGIIIISSVILSTATQKDLNALPVESQLSEVPNTPIGEPKGYWPGRVAWVMDKDATNEISDEEFWFENTNLTVVRKMLADGIKRYTDTTDLAIAWDCLFRYFNLNHGKGWTGYVPGEKIMIKINTTNLGSGGHHMGEWMNSTPELVYSLLEELIDSVGIPQNCITIGDPYRGFANEYYSLCHSKYPDVHYIEGQASEGRELTAISSGHKFFNSDNNFRSRLPSAIVNANYLINMPCLKSHGSAGISVAAKNHQGSVIGDDQNAGTQHMGSYLHYDFPDNPENCKMGLYRHLVDYMAHSKLGGNTLLYIVDAIWSGRDWMGIVEKFGMTPFNNDYTSSVFISQDAVAIESVAFDFLYAEYASFPSLHKNVDFPLRVGVQDYIHQAADPRNWPAGIQYDPDHADHHNPVGSLGVHEHWNNPADKKYSVNINGNKGGIHLVSVPKEMVESVPLNFSHSTNPTYIDKTIINALMVYPNPTSGQITVDFNLKCRSSVSINIFSLNGQLNKQLFSGIEDPGSFSRQFELQLSPSTYICQVTIYSNGASSSTSAQIIVR